MDPRATRLQLLDFTTIPMRAFHLLCAACALAVRFTQQQKADERQQYNDALERKAAQAQAQAIADAA
jgi:hypothetical protein